ncbi:hypothetical protein ACWD6R_32310 [Streptomyces sp. NPDC005151]
MPEGPSGEGIVHLLAAVGMGPDEVGADAMAHAFAATGMFGLPAPEWAQMLSAAERGDGPAVDWSLLDRAFDPLAQAQRAVYQDLLDARTVLTGLRGFGAMYFMHALFMPDTPGLAALRERIDASGMGAALIGMLNLSASPAVFAWDLTVCLDRSWHELHDALFDQLISDPRLFDLSGQEPGAAHFMDTWIRAAREQIPPS